MSLAGLKRDLNVARENIKALAGESQAHRSSRKYWENKVRQLELLIAEKGECPRCGGMVEMKQERRGRQVVEMFECRGCGYKSVAVKPLLGR